MNYGGYDNQYSTTSYSAGGGAGGGGFMAGGSQDAAQAGRSIAKDTLRPVTIRQINSASQPHPDADFKIDDAEVGQVTFVGQIRNISSQVTNVTYRIDDGTGTVEVKLWIETEAKNPTEDEDGNAKLKENDYVRVYGTLKSFHNKRHVGARMGGIKLVTDHNEINYHLLEATAVHLYFKHGPPDAQKASQSNGNYAGQSDEMNGVEATGGKRQLPAGMTMSARRVYQCMSDTAQSNEGLHMQDIAARLSMDMSEVGKAGDELLANGLIYTTVDDSTWAILDDI